MKKKFCKTPFAAWRSLAGGIVLCALFAGCGSNDPVPQTETAEPSPAEAVAAPVLPPHAGRPRLLDLGAHACIPCKMMAPILEDLKKNYAERFETYFVDVWANPEIGQQYGVQTIPTQIFFDAAGEERFRHVGFMAKEAILAKWRELGVAVPEA